jgi:hypothetical protein
MMGPLMVDQFIRKAIQQCWMALPKEIRSPKRVEQEILRLVQRAPQDMREDTATFGFLKKDDPGWKGRLARMRLQYPKAYEKWTGDEDNLLRQKFRPGVSVLELARLFQRHPGAIRSRLARLGLI